MTLNKEQLDIIVWLIRQKIKELGTKDADRRVLRKYSKLLFALTGENL